jgi:hypothetical protein
MFDQDGSLSGTGVPTYLIANNNRAVLPISSSLAANCAYVTNWNAYACRNVCYRT